VSEQPYRIISLLPSATEIIAALGLGDCLVGRSHECDFPAAVQGLPVCTAANLDAKGSSQQIHGRVSELLEKSLSIYRLDLQKIEQLQPTHIITQAQCDVCAVSLAEVEAAVQTQLTSKPVVISLQPNTLTEVWQDLARTAQGFGVDATSVIQELQTRVAASKKRTQALPHRSVACIEWTDPLMAAGNWVPELVDLAGGQNLFGQLGQHSPWLAWTDLLAADPEVIIFMPCGFDLAQTRQAVTELAAHPDWPTLTAVQTGAVYLTDGNQYFNRPGPRLVDSIEILAEILHPHTSQRHPPFYQGQAWQVWDPL
jgi:iron complex transport system substrate-binding protein